MLAPRTYKIINRYEEKLKAIINYGELPDTQFLYGRFKQQTIKQIEELADKNVKHMVFMPVDKTMKLRIQNSEEYILKEDLKKFINTL